jgi:hypothetical protein
LGKTFREGYKVLMRFIEVFSFIVVMVIIITQIAIPLIQNIPLFPIFRKRQRRLESEIAEANQRAFERKLQNELIKRNKK